MTDHEILLELRQDVKSILEKIPHFVTWAKLGGAAVTVAGLILSIIKLT